jgi:pre-rRNA-processing protein TSR4
MPNLINVLQRPDVSSAKDDEGRQKAVQATLHNSEGARGMSWGTCLVFSCQDDCRVGPETGKDLKEVWREEYVLVQWDK